ncbi:unnamed protein product, partial [Ilex paraguariensis]
MEASEKMMKKGTSKLEETMGFSMVGAIGSSKSKKIEGQGDGAKEASFASARIGDAGVVGGDASVGRLGDDKSIENNDGMASINKMGNKDGAQGTTSDAKRDSEGGTDGVNGDAVRGVPMEQLAMPKARLSVVCQGQHIGVSSVKGSVLGFVMEGECDAFWL